MNRKEISKEVVARFPEESCQMFQCFCCRDISLNVAKGVDFTYLMLVHKGGGGNNCSESCSFLFYHLIGMCIFLC
jgi:hypothetical protein